MVFLCLACYYKGMDFIIRLKELGNIVYVVTSQSLEHESWPMECIDEMFYMEEDDIGEWDMDKLVAGIAHIMRSRKIDRIVALDDFDVERAAFLRENFRIDGMGQSTVRFFRDKLAMRFKAKEEGINVPPFSSLFLDQAITDFLHHHPGPWIIKPRAQASAAGIQKVDDFDQAWNAIHALGDHRHNYLIESFLPGDVYHVDGLSIGGELVFSRASKYLRPPFEVAHGGGIFQSVTLPVDHKEEIELKKHTTELLGAFGMKHSASHSEFLRSDHDGKYYFIETASRVGGAHISEMIEIATNINLWKEWATIEHSQLSKTHYNLPVIREDNAGIIISLIQQEQADYSMFQDQEIAWTLTKDHHIGMIITHQDQQRIIDLMDGYAEVIRGHFHASMPPGERVTH